MRCKKCGTEEERHYDGVQCPVGASAYSSTMQFTPMTQPADWRQAMSELKIPEDLKDAYELSQEYAKTKLGCWSASEYICTLIERIADLTAALKAKDETLEKVRDQRNDLDERLQRAESELVEARKESNRLHSLMDDVFSIKDELRENLVLEFNKFRSLLGPVPTRDTPAEKWLLEKLLNAGVYLDTERSGYEKQTADLTAVLKEKDDEIGRLKVLARKAPESIMRYSWRDVPEHCPVCDGKTFISDGPNALICYCCTLLQWINKAETENAVLRAQVERLSEFLVPEFLEAMSQIGAYGHKKYGEESFQARRLKGDSTRGPMRRCQSQAIADHARTHFDMYLNHEVHDHFGTDAHQLAAVAFNAMMEFYFAGLAARTKEPDHDRQGTA